MYNTFRDEFATRLVHEFSAEDTNKILRLLDRQMSGYKIEVAETALVANPQRSWLYLDMYLACKKLEGQSDATLDGARTILSMFLSSVAKDPQDITTTDIRAYLSYYKQQRNVSDRTLDKYRSYILTFFNWMYKEKYIQDNPAERIPVIHYEVKQREALTQMDLEKIRYACKDERDRAIIEFMYSTGCRVGELVVVKKTDINFLTGEVHLFGKGKKHRTALLNDKAKLAITMYLNTREDESPYLFVSNKAPHDKLKTGAVQKVMRRLGADACIDKSTSPHIMRHTFATQAVANGMPIQSVSALLGHEQISTTMIYTTLDLATIQMEHRRCVA